MSTTPIVPRTRTGTDILSMGQKPLVRFRRQRRVLVSPAGLSLFLMVLLCAPTLLAQTPAQTPKPATAQDPDQVPPTLDVTVTVVGTTPLPGVELPRDEVPTPVQTATGRDIDNSGALNLADFLNRRVNGVIVNGMPAH